MQQCYCLHLYLVRDRNVILLLPSADITFLTPSKPLQAQTKFIYYIVILIINFNNDCIKKIDHFNYVGNTRSLYLTDEGRLYVSCILNNTSKTYYTTLVKYN